jgi:hypothetical protein
MASLQDSVRSVIEPYAVKGANFESFLTISPDGNLFTVVDIAVDNQNRRFTATSLIVRVMGERVVIEYDDNDKPLVDALVQAGFPLERIVLAYKDETTPA